MHIDNIQKAYSISRDFANWQEAAEYHNNNPDYGAQVHFGRFYFDVGREQAKAVLDARRAEIQARADAIGLTLQSKDSKDASAGR